MRMKTIGIRTDSLKISQANYSWKMILWKDERSYMRSNHGAVGGTHSWLQNWHSVLTIKSTYTKINVFWSSFFFFFLIQKFTFNSLLEIPLLWSYLGVKLWGELFILGSAFLQECMKVSAARSFLCCPQTLDVTWHLFGFYPSP